MRDQKVCANTPGIKKIIFYTVLTNGYDHVPTPPRTGERFTCLLFTDAKPLPSFPAFPEWRVMPIDVHHSRSNLSHRQVSRLPKILPHKFLPPHSISIYADANLHFTGVPFLPLTESVHTIAAAEHVHRGNAIDRDCVYGEAKVCVKLGLDHPAAVNRHVKRYQRQGFPARFGLLENCFIIRRNCRSVRALNERWWQEYRRGSQRDQLSLMYCLWKTGVQWCVLPVHARRNAFYYQVPHLKHRTV